MIGAGACRRPARRPAPVRRGGAATPGGGRVPAPPPSAAPPPVCRRTGAQARPGRLAPAATGPAGRTRPGAQTSCRSVAPSIAISRQAVRQRPAGRVWRGSVIRTPRAVRTSLKIVSAPRTAARTCRMWDCGKVWRERRRRLRRGGGYQTRDGTYWPSGLGGRRGGGVEWAMEYKGRPGRSFYPSNLQPRRPA